MSPFYALLSGKTTEQIMTVRIGALATFVLSNMTKPPLAH